VEEKEVKVKLRKVSKWCLTPFFQGGTKKSFKMVPDTFLFFIE
jgi:hypothetical protein